MTEPTKPKLPNDDKVQDLDNAGDVENSLEVTSDSETQSTQSQESQLEEVEAELAYLRKKLQEAPKRVRTLEEKLLEVKGQLAHAISQNEKLTFTLSN